MKQHKIKAALLLLAGGRGVRMGRNKLYLSVEGRPVVDFFLATLSPLFAETVLCVGEEDDGALAALLREHGVTVAMDRSPGLGPLEGLRQGLFAMSSEWGFLLGIDMLRVSEAVIRQMWELTPAESDVCAYVRNGRHMALHAFYRKSCVPHIDAAMAGGNATSRGGAKIISFYNQVSVATVTDDDLSFLPGYRRSFENYNTPRDLDKMLEGR